MTLLNTPPPPQQQQHQNEQRTKKQHATFGPRRGASSPSPSLFLRCRCGATAATSSLASSSASSSSSSSPGGESRRKQRSVLKPPVPTFIRGGGESDGVGNESVEASSSFWEPLRRERDWVSENVVALAAAFTADKKKGANANADDNSSSSPIRHDSFGYPPPYLSSIKAQLAREKHEKELEILARLPAPAPKPVPLLGETRAAALAASRARLSAARAALAAMPLTYDTPSRSRAREAAEKAALEAEEDVKLLEEGRVLYFLEV